MRKILEKVEGAISAALLILTSLLVFIQVILRYFFNHSISWSEEIALLMIAWFIFIGCSVAVRENAHVSMEVLENIVSKKTNLYLSVLINIIGIGFCGVMANAGVGMVRNAINLNSMATSINMPLWIAYLSVPVGMTLMLIQYGFKLYDSVVAIGNYEEEVTE